jgi:hypothetical protein
VDRDRVLYPPGVAACAGHHHGHPAAARRLKDALIARLQAIDRQRESAELITDVRIGAGEVADELGSNRRRRAERDVEPGQVLRVPNRSGRCVDG